MSGSTQLPPQAAPSPPPAPKSALDDDTAADHIRALYVQTPTTLAANGIGLLLMAMIFGPLAPRPTVLAWLGVGAALWVLRLLHWLRFRAQPQAPARVLQAWRRSWMALVLSQGTLWGSAVWLFWGLGTPYHHVVLILIVYSYCLGSVQMLATQRKVLLAFISLVLVPTILRIATDFGQEWNLQLAFILTLLFLLTLLMARTYRHALGQAMALKRRTEELATRLRHEMELAEEARRAAEAANRAKTQFFAAASHDLRQPLHAMGLFAEALRQRLRDPEVASLVNSINESVDALEGLFGELLDITRIDTGGVDVKPEPVRLKELFGRLRLHFEPTAFEKGLMLSFRGEQHVAMADAVLLERVLRNLVCNAIRYTDDGGVLVSARVRESGPRGRRLLLQVWDSGVGIPEASLPRIFDEFYQAQGVRPLQAHQRKGLGLGLAIVKRLAALMEAPVTVRSRAGHGTVFSLEVPLGRAPRMAEATPGHAARSALGLALEQRHVVVVEDEAAVREGLVVLLQAWGAEVTSFDTVEAVERWLTGAAPERAPDLLLVDHRLPQGRTGLDALATLRARWPRQRLPAIVVTGSSLGGHEAEAEQHDFHLLIKPVLPAKLRATIAFKLEARG